jgi:hypothetical protein
MYKEGICPKQLADHVQTRQKFKEAYDHYFAATIERAEKQTILAKHARRLLNLVDDTPVVPGDLHPPFANGEEARQVLNDAEDDLRNYELHVEPIHSQSGNLGTGAMPGAPIGAVGDTGAAPVQDTTQYQDTVGTSGVGASEDGRYAESNVQGTDVGSQPPYPVSEAERLEQQQATQQTTQQTTQQQPIAFQHVA